MRDEGIVGVAPARRADDPVLAAPTGLAAAPAPRRWAVARRFARNKLAVAGLLTIVVLYSAALAEPLIGRYPYDEIGFGLRDKPPSADHWLGTDRQSRDVWARLVKGGQVSLAAGFAAVVIIMTIGVTLGGLAGFFGGWVDALLMRFTDILLAIPLILLLITAASLFQPSLRTTIVVIGLSSWPGAARLVRGQFLALKGQEFVTAARAIGAPPGRIMLRHLLPNTLAIIIVEATLWLSYAILLEASLSYLGLGVQIPTPSWGNMLQDGQRELLAGAWWLTLFPGMAIFLTVLAFNLVGDGLRDALDPRHRRR
ncbi:MAG: ABC transporter, permease protein 2 (cluster 5, nickel/peptides/opines) [uncultured Thermomicrobiales bacterium]|uniref:ABC transporter, permease protein 2 (Cluster 5, nickel/peptides/opines) n=1 Tax=uncultured Thermomicrobiales bacterium TaxID=1645740 RepID=A0A6J4VG27_9BACT|nr:MAG: ABC transporter, permease protein 2 (cluster 5, nickel/peptides/opines) [uncultured Thermomicrobiales bacterium]